MKIDVYAYPSCTWELDGETFVCTHDEREVYQYSEDHLGFHGHYNTEHWGYSCADCGVGLPGDPEAERLEYMQEAEAEAQLMELLNK